jgi:AcrR family transcriptional regulator
MESPRDRTATQPSLRERQRDDARRLIHEATLDLFEEQGVNATTVQQIADRVGISSRTFFRYFKTKERAALLAHTRLMDDLAELDVRGLTLSEAFGVVQSMMGAAMDTGVHPERSDSGRLARLMAAEPDFAGYVCAQDFDLAEQLRALLEKQLPDEDRLGVVVLAESAIMSWRVSWIQWGGSAERPPSAVHAQVTEALRGLVS